MFEQESYNQETPAAPTQEGDLFHKYEIKPWEFSPRIYKIIGVAALANLLFFTGVAQTNVMTMRGCESPFVGRVCQVLDMAYVGTVLFGTEREYVDVAYEKTDLGDAEITFISMDRNEPMFEYPPGYFQPEPELIDPLTGFNTSGSQIAPGIHNPTLGKLPAQRLPRNNPNPVKGKVSDPWGDETDNGGENPTVDAKGKNGKLGDGTKADATTDPKTKPTVDPTKPVDAVVINREPMRKYGSEVAKKIDEKKVDISQNFKVTAVAVLDKDGKMDVTIDKKTKLQKSRVLSAEGDAEMVKVVTDAIAAVGDSGWLGYLRNEGIEKLNFTFSQTDNELLVDISSEQLTPERARSISSKLANVLSAAILADNSGFVKLGPDEKALLQAATATSDGKTVLVNFKLPKPVAQEMIIRNVNKARESEAGRKPAESNLGASTNKDTTAR